MPLGAQVHNFALPKSMEAELLQAKAPDEGESTEAAEQVTEAPTSLSAYAPSHGGCNKAEVHVRC